MTEVRTASPTRPTRYIPVAIGAVVALFGVLVGGYFFWGWLNRQSEAQQQIYHHSVREITLDTSSADLTFESGKSDEVVVNRQLSWTYGKPNIQETWDGDVLRISSNCTRGLGSNGCSIGYRIDVPAGVLVDGHVNSGNTSLSDLTGGVRLTTSSGDVTTSSISGPLWLRASSGAVTGSALHCSDVDISSSSGDVALDFVASPHSVKADVRSGNLDIAVPKADTYEVEASVNSGSRNVDIADDRTAGRVISAQTTSGDLHIRYAG